MRHYQPQLAMARDEVQGNLDQYLAAIRRQVELIAEFELARKPKKTLDKKTVDVYQLFMDELNIVKREITARNAIIDQMHPHYAGAALWAKGLKRRIEKYNLKS